MLVFVWLLFNPMQAMDISSQKIAAWDCNLDNTRKFTEFSLMHVSDCTNISSDYRLASESDAQLVKAVNFFDISVISCQLIADYFTNYCSYSLLSGYRLWGSQNLVSGIQMKLSRSECKNAITTQKLEYQDKLYFGKMSILTIPIPPSLTGTGWMTLRGETSSDTGTCYPDSFFVGTEFFPNHVLTMRYKVIIKNQHGVFNTRRQIISVGKINIPNQQTGKYFSPAYGNFFWESIPEGNLTDSIWREISSGSVKIYNSRSKKHANIALFENAVINQSIAFAIRNKTSLCIRNSCRTAYELEINYIFLVLYSLGQSRIPLDEVSGSNVNKLENLHSSLTSVFLSQELRLTASFELVSRELCKLSREIIKSNIRDYIKNVLSPKYDLANHFRYHIKAGSVLYAIRCTETEVTLRNDQADCSDFVPITYTHDNVSEDAYIDPLTYVIKPHAIHTPCSDILIHKYSLMRSDGRPFWLCKSTSGWNVDCKEPVELSPLQPESPFLPAEKLISPNLYSTEQIQSVKSLQWSDNLKDENLQDWSKFLNSVKTKRFKNDNFFHNLSQFVAPSYLNQLLYNIIFSKIWPLFVANYIINAVISLLRAIFKIKDLYNTTGISKRLLINSPIFMFLALFPINLPKETHRPCDCPCKRASFASEISEEIEAKERQRFLANLS